MVAGVIPFLPPAAVAGIRTGAACAGIKRTDRNDLVLFELAPGSTCAAVFTRNAFCAAPVTVAREHLGRAAPRYLLINSGNANAGTGASGRQDARATCQLVAALAGVSPEAVLPFSTGVIGQPLPVEKFRAAVPLAFTSLSTDAWTDAAHAIMTTDTVPKAMSKSIMIDGQPMTVAGIAKGAGMIRPDMATMLAFVATDAAVERDILQHMLETAADRSFNRITVDGDTSTNDACVLMATGGSGSASIRSIDAASAQTLQSAVDEVCGFLAEAIVRDGEGATKLIRIVVGNGRNREECLAVAYTIAHSPLVKTAFFASDANWGRILAAIGRAGVRDLDLQAVTVDLNGVRIIEQGGRAGNYTEEAGQAAMQPADITVTVNLAQGDTRETVMTCDFSYDYVRINAEYRS